MVDLSLVDRAKVDVLILDHHVCAVPTHQITEPGRHVVINVNSTAGAETFALFDWFTEHGFDSVQNGAECDYSGCGVVYEFFRLMFAVQGRQFPAMLEQFVGISLYSDLVSTLSKRNQYYVRSLLSQGRTHPELSTLLHSFSSFFKPGKGVSRSLVEYSLSPGINNLIRSGKSIRLLPALNGEGSVIALTNAEREAIARIKDEIVGTAKRQGGVVLCNYKDSSFASYFGLAANQILNDTRGEVSAAIVVAKRDTGTYSGSFRGVGSAIDYLSLAGSLGIDCGGHRDAFGITRASGAELRTFVTELNNAVDLEGEPVLSEREWVLENNSLSVQELSQLISTVGLFNSRVCSLDSITLVDSVGDFELVETRGKTYRYAWQGLIAVAFAPLVQGRVFVSVEDSGGQVTINLKQ
jgi:single-stranded DNA-specific DHH superfamily exonuclease